MIDHVLDVNGGPRVRQDRLIYRCHIPDRLVTAQQTDGKHCKQMSAHTVRRRRRRRIERALRARVPYRGPILDPEGEIDISDGSRHIIVGLWKDDGLCCLPMQLKYEWTT